MGRIIVLGRRGDQLNQIKVDVERLGHNVITFDIDNVSEALHTKKPDLALVDLTVFKNIIDTWHQIRSDVEDSHTSVIVIVPHERIRDIELLKGIRDFIIYPYDLRELDIRIRLILAKQESASSQKVIKIGNITIDTTRYEVTVDGWPVMLTLKEYELLRYLVTHRGRVLTREMLLDQVWGYDYYGGTRTVDVHIGRLRTKIETGNYSFIRTVRGVGYIFDEYTEDKV
ncbi:MAG: winged helix-turn-helix domain-containing protein [bacterium]